MRLRHQKCAHSPRRHVCGRHARTLAILRDDDSRDDIEPLLSRCVRGRRGSQPSVRRILEDRLPGRRCRRRRYVLRACLCFSGYPVSDNLHLLEAVADAHLRRSLAFVYKRIQTYYLATSRELKRLDATTKSPIFAAFQESLGGLATIRAYQQQDRFITHNQSQLDRNLQAYYPSFSCNRWLAVRLELIGSLLIFSAAQLSVVTLVHSRGIDAGLVGLLMSYALNTTQSLNWIVRSATEVETNIVSIERIVEYTNLPSEAPLVLPDRRPRENWPEHGAITFENYSTRYKEGLELVLKDVSFEIKPGTKVGVCGRTGAGKSTLTLALYRVIERVSGRILVDDVSTAVPSHGFIAEHPIRLI